MIMVSGLNIMLLVSDGMVCVWFVLLLMGFLYVGGVCMVLFNYLYAKKMGGKFVFRVEDTD